VRSTAAPSAARPRRRILGAEAIVTALAYGCVLVVLTAVVQFTLSR
jgi:hypothetical protein